MVRQMEQTSESLRERCHINTNIEDDTFVGIVCDQKGARVNFPLGFDTSDEDDNELRSDILILMQAIARTTANRESEINNLNTDYFSNAAPIAAYLNVIRDFYARGYYHETEVQYSQGKSGKISWGRTIKNIRPVIQDNEVYYLDFIIRRSSINYNELITQIHKYCVYQSMKNLGWLFTSYIPPEPQIRFNKKLIESVVSEKLSSTFNDRNRILFRSMLAIIDWDSDENKTALMYGTNRFEYVWESLIDQVYGIDEKKEYFPKTRWVIRGKEYDSSSLEPDSIMLYNGNVYILDAKYYRFGWTTHAGDLPASSSINKQITYGEYAEGMKKNKGKKIYNAFIMPFNSLQKEWINETRGDTILNIGKAVSDWKKGDKEYENIQGILVDTKHLMRIVTRRDTSEIIRLAEAIEKGFSDAGMVNVNV